MIKKRSFIKIGNFLKELILKEKKLIKISMKSKIFRLIITSNEDLYTCLQMLTSKNLLFLFICIRSMLYFLKRLKRR